MERCLAGAAGDSERLVRLVTAHAQPMLLQGEVSTVQSWLESLPAGTLQRRPELCVIQAWLLFIRRWLQAVEPFLQAAEQELETVGPSGREALRGEILTIRAFVTGEQGRFAEAVDQVRRALTLLPEDRLFVRSFSALALGHALYSLGETAPAVDALKESVRLCRAAQSDKAGARAALEQARGLAEPEGYARIFLDEGAPLAELLAQLPSRPYRDRLLAAFSDFRLGLTDKSKI